MEDFDSTTQEASTTAENSVEAGEPGLDNQQQQVASPGAKEQAAAAGLSSEEGVDLELILDVPVEVTVELGRARMVVAELLGLHSGAIVELSKTAGEPVDLVVGGKVIAKGEVVVVDDNFGIRITDIPKEEESTGD